MQPSAAGGVERCFKCGGFWLGADTANNLTAAELTTWRRIAVNSAYLSGGKGVCPADGQMLERYSGDEVPTTLVVMRCGRCGKWWFPGDNLFRFKPALEAKKNYLRLWGLPLTRGVLLPGALVLFLTGATVVGVKTVRAPQQTRVAATGNITEFSAVYSGEGRAMAVFKAENEVGDVEYKSVDGGRWVKANTEMQNGYHVAWMEGLEEGREYVVRVEGKEYRFVAK